VVGADRVEWRDAQHGSSEEDVGGGSNGAEPRLSDPEFASGVVASAFVVAKGDMELDSRSGVDEELRVGKNGSIGSEKLEVTANERDGGLGGWRFSRLCRDAADGTCRSLRLTILGCAAAGKDAKTLGVEY
jgi:hypothetical protein